jgi:hypothetical protein
MTRSVAPGGRPSLSLLSRSSCRLSSCPISPVGRARSLPPSSPPSVGLTASNNRLPAVSRLIVKSVLLNVSLGVERWTGPIRRTPRIRGDSVTTAVLSSPSGSVGCSETTPARSTAVSTVGQPGISTTGNSATRRSQPRRRVGSTPSVPVMVRPASSAGLPFRRRAAFIRRSVGSGSLWSSSGLSRRCPYWRTRSPTVVR